jgi:hypothetical protein
MWSGSAEKEWNKEIARRIDELDSGVVKPVSWSDARYQLSVVMSSNRREPFGDPSSGATVCRGIVDRRPNAG